MKIFPKKKRVLQKKGAVVLYGPFYGEPWSAIIRKLAKDHKAYGSAAKQPMAMNMNKILVSERQLISNLFLSIIQMLY